MIYKIFEEFGISYVSETENFYFQFYSECCRITLVMKKLDLQSQKAVTEQIRTFPVFRTILENPYLLLNDQYANIKICTVPSLHIYVPFFQ